MNKKLKILRVQKGYTQDDLARKSGISRVSVVQIERGQQMPSLETAKKIAKALDTTVEEIFPTSSLCLNNKMGVEPQKKDYKMEKMILKVHKSEPIGSDIVRINKSAAELVKQMQTETGLPASKIVSECIKFASQHYEVLEV